MYIVERTRNVLVEHFSNIDYAEPAFQNHTVIDQQVYDEVFGPDYNLDIHLIQYQTEHSSLTDPFNLFDRVDPEARSLFYGITTDNRVFIDGLKIGAE